MIVYIAGKMNGLSDKGRAAFAKAEEMLEEKGFIVLNPAWLPDGMEPEQYMPICLAMLEQADEIVMLDGWEKSCGATIERYYAIYQGKNVMYLKGVEFE